MASVALIGADGAGKTTIGQRLSAQTEIDIEYMYLGVNAQASNHLSPTTRLTRWVKERRGKVDEAGPPRSLDEVAAQRAATSDWRSRVRATLRLGNRLTDEWYRQLIAWRLQRRGAVVVFDRHYLADFHAHDMTGDQSLPLDRRVHGLLLRRFYPRPDRVIFLDAPPEVLLARKGEGSLEDLARRRADYLAVGHDTADFVVVDATQTVDAVFSEVLDSIRELTAADLATR